MLFHNWRTYLRTGITWRLYMDKDNFRILLIKDDEDDYVLIKSLLTEARSATYHLDWARDYEQGLASLCGAGYDACLLDYLLGAHNGLELLRETINSDCAFPVILLTGQETRSSIWKHCGPGPPITW